MKTQIKTRQQRQAHYYDRKARDLPPQEEGDVVRMRPFALNGKTWEKASVSKGLDERSYQVETEDATYVGETELTFERYKAQTKKISRNT